LRNTANIAVAAMVLAGSTLAASPAHADIKPLLPVICDNGEVTTSFTTVTADRTLTHVRYFSVPAGGSLDVAKGVTKIATITASVKFTSDSTLEANEVIAKESEKVGVELAASGSVTLQTATNVTYHMGPGAYAVFAGEKKFSGSWSSTKCTNNGTREAPNGDGTAVSFAVPGDGAASCTGNYASGTFEYKAKAYGC
jgi:hypothetical protein